MSGLDNLTSRVNYLGGNAKGRINNSKVKSLQSAFKNAYQAETIQLIRNGEQYQCLINPDQLTPDYDNKTVSILRESGLKSGDTFYWVENNTYWIVYLPAVMETAYFRGYIRRCRYKIMINDAPYYVAIKGPTETNAAWARSSGAGARFNKPNLTSNLYITKTQEVLDYFDRFNQVELAEQMWQVVATDRLSVEGVLEVSLGEDFNTLYDDLQKLPSVTEIDPLLPHINGPSFVKPYDKVSYSIVLTSGGAWSISNDKAIVISAGDDDVVEIEIVSSKSGTFNLVYSVPDHDDVIFKVNIESLL